MEDGITGWNNHGIDRVTGRNNQGIDGITGRNNQGIYGITGWKNHGIDSFTGRNQGWIDGITGRNNQGIDKVTGRNNQGIDGITEIENQGFLVIFSGRASFQIVSPHPQFLTPTQKTSNFQYLCSCEVILLSFSLCNIINSDDVSDASKYTFKKITQPLLTYSYFCPSLINNYSFALLEV